MPRRDSSRGLLPLLLLLALGVSLLSGCGDGPSGAATPIPPLDRETVYLSVEGDANSSGQIVALRASDGTAHWTASVAASGAPWVAPDPSGGVVAAGAVVEDLRASDGQALWVASGAGQPLTPVVTADRVYVSTTGPISRGQPVIGNGVYALDRRDGSVRWHFAISGAEDETSLVAVDAGVNGADGTVYVCTVVVDAAGAPTGSAVYALRASDGTLLWRTVIPGRANLAQVAAGEGVAYVVTAGNPSGGQVAALRASDGAMLWHVALDSGSYAPPVLASGLVLIASADSSLVALRSSDGSLAWRAQLGSAGLLSAPAVNGTMVYAAARDGSLYALDLPTGVLRQRVPVIGTSGDDIATTPVIAGGSLYVAMAEQDRIASHDADGVYALDLANLSVRWVYHATRVGSVAVALSP